MADPASELLVDVIRIDPEKIGVVVNHWDSVNEVWISSYIIFSYNSGYGSDCIDAGAMSGNLLDGSDLNATPTETGETITITAQRIRRFKVYDFPSGEAAGTEHNVTVKAVDKHDATADDYRGTIHFSSSDHGATLPSDYAFTADDAGIVSLPVTFKTPGQQVVTVQDTIFRLLTNSQTGIEVLES